MDLSDWLIIDVKQAVGISVSAIGIYLGLMLFTKLMGLRSFSKISSHDFAMTVGIGSILASTVLSDSPTLMQGLLAIAVLFILQAVVSLLRRKVKFIKNLVDNEPLILMSHGNYHWSNIKSANLSKSDIQEVLRKNGLKSKAEVFTVVMETTGDMSVIKNNDVMPDYDLFDDIRDYELLINNSSSTKRTNAKEPNPKFHNFSNNQVNEPLNKHKQDIT